MLGPDRILNLGFHSLDGDRDRGRVGDEGGLRKSIYGTADEEEKRGTDRARPLLRVVVVGGPDEAGFLDRGTIKRSWSKAPSRMFGWD